LIACKIRIAASKPAKPLLVSEALRREASLDRSSGRRRLRLPGRL
jgi:hypothetical protein